MRGNLRQTGLAVLARHLYARRKSGILHLVGPELRKRVFFREGALVFADDGEGAPTPGRADALELLQSLFGWTSGEISFEEGPPELGGAPAFETSTEELILEATRSLDDKPTLEVFLGTDESVLARTETTVLPVPEAKLSAAETGLLQFARKRPHFRRKDIPHLPAEELALMRALNTLVSVGLLTITRKVESAPPVASAPEPFPPGRAVAAPAPEDPTDVEAILERFGSMVAPSAPAADSESAIAEPDEPPAPIESAPAPDPHPEPVRDAPEVSLDGAPESAAPLPSNASPKRPPKLPPRPGSRNASSSKARLLALGAVAACAAVAAAAWFAWTASRRAQANPVVAAAPAPPPVEVPEELEPTAEEMVDELFERASAAFEQGDFASSKSELDSLFEIDPEFAAARELLARVDRELAPPPPRPQPREEPAPRPAAPPPPPKPVERQAIQTTLATFKPTTPETHKLFREAQNAFEAGDLSTAQARLDAMHELDDSYRRAEELRQELEYQRWRESLPLEYPARHDHTFRGCDGVLSLTEEGFAFRSSAHAWAWPAAELAESERKHELQISLQTSEGKRYNFELREPLRFEDWTRFVALTGETASRP